MRRTSFRTACTPAGVGGDNQSDGGKGSDGYVLVTWG